MRAATLDGAGKIAQFFRITLPLLTPMVFSISSCRLLTLSSRLTPRILSAMVPADRWIPPCSHSLYLYIKAFNHFQMGYASAMAWILLLIIAVVTGLMFLFAKFWVFYDD